MAPRFLEDFCTPSYLVCDPTVWLISTSGLQGYVALISRSFLSCRLAQQVHLNIGTCLPNEQNVPNNSESYRSFQNCGSLVWKVLHVTVLVPVNPHCKLNS
jgi:hypothetical protein